MNEQIVRTVELELICKTEYYYCINCGKSGIEAPTFLLIEKKSKHIVAYKGFGKGEHFLCAVCEKNKGE